MLINKNLLIIVLYIFEVSSFCTTNSLLSCNYNIKGYATVTCSDKCLSVGTISPKNSLYYCNSTSTSRSTITPGSSSTKTSTIAPRSYIGLIAGVASGGTAILLLSFCFIFWKVKTNRAKNIQSGNSETKSKGDIDLKPVTESKEPTVKENINETTYTQTEQKTDNAATVNLHKLFNSISKKKLIVSPNIPPEQIKSVLTTETDLNAPETNTPEVVPDRRRSINKACDVMISFSVKSMVNTARKLQALLHEKGYSTWLCLDIKPGENFRDKIIENARFCNTFVPMINEDWALSKECEFEYNIALKSCNKTRKPIIVPIIIGMFDTSQYNVIEGLLASTQVIFVENKDENSDAMSIAFKQVIDVLQSLH